MIDKQYSICLEWLGILGRMSNVSLIIESLRLRKTIKIIYSNHQHPYHSH